MKLILIHPDRDEGVALPWYYGRAYRRYDRRDTVCAIIPFNLVIGAWVDRILPFMRRGWMNERLHMADNEGYERGYHLGLLVGKDVAKREIQEAIDKLAREHGIIK